MADIYRRRTSDTLALSVTDLRTFYEAVARVLLRILYSLSSPAIYLTACLFGCSTRNITACIAKCFITYIWQVATPVISTTASLFS